MALLAISGLSKSFRGLRAVANASLEVPEHAIVALIGPNGAGKTTIFNMAAGVYAPDAGEIRFAGRRIDGLRPDQICAAGIGRRSGPAAARRCVCRRTGFLRHPARTPRRPC